MDETISLVYQKMQRQSYYIWQAINEELDRSERHYRESWRPRGLGLKCSCYSQIQWKGKIMFRCLKINKAIKRDTSSVPTLESVLDGMSDSKFCYSINSSFEKVKKAITCKLGVTSNLFLTISIFLMKLNEILFSKKRRPNFRSSRPEVFVL